MTNRNPTDQFQPSLWTSGHTHLLNLGPLCTHDHHLVHEGGWHLSMTPDRNATWTRPDGTIDHTGTTIDRAPNGIAPPAHVELQLAIA